MVESTSTQGVVAHQDENEGNGGPRGHKTLPSRRVSCSGWTHPSGWDSDNRLARRSNGVALQHPADVVLWINAQLLSWRQRQSLPRRGRRQRRPAGISVAGV